MSAPAFSAASEGALTRVPSANSVFSATSGLLFDTGAAGAGVVPALEGVPNREVVLGNGAGGSVGAL